MTVEKTHKNAKLSIKTSEKTLANALQTVYYVLASEREQRKQPLRESGRTKKRTKKTQKERTKKC